MKPNRRRQHERYACEMVVWMRFPGTGDEYILADVENISSGGILINMIDPMPLQMQLELKISLLQMEEMVAVKAKVCHEEKLEENEYQIGLQFLETRPLALPTFMACLEAMFS